MSDLRDHSRTCGHKATDGFDGAYEWAGHWHCGNPACPGGREVTDAELVRMAAEAQQADPALAVVWAGVFAAAIGDTE